MTPVNALNQPNHEDCESSKNAVKTAVIDDQTIADVANSSLSINRERTNAYSDDTSGGLRTNYSLPASSSAGESVSHENKSVRSLYRSQKIIINGEIIEKPKSPSKSSGKIHQISDFRGSENEQVEESRPVTEMRETVRDVTASLSNMAQQMDAESASTREAIATADRTLGNTREMIGMVNGIIDEIKDLNDRAEIRDAKERERDAKELERDAKERERDAQTQKQIAKLKECRRLLDQRNQMSVIEPSPEGRGMQWAGNRNPLKFRNDESSSERQGFVKPDENSKIKVQSAQKATDKLLLSARNWKVIGGVALGVITLVAIGIIFGIIPTVFTGMGMAMGNGFGWMLHRNAIARNTSAQPGPDTDAGPSSLSFSQSSPNSVTASNPVMGPDTISKNISSVAE